MDILFLYHVKEKSGLHVINKIRPKSRPLNTQTNASLSVSYPCHPFTTGMVSVSMLTEVHFIQIRSPDEAPDLYGAAGESSAIPIPAI